MKLLLMGAGYVGMALLDYLQSQSHEIFITTTSQERIESLKPYGEVVFLHPTDDNSLKELIDSCDAMVVLVAPKDSQSYEETYLTTAKKISSACKDRQKPFYLLYTSSTSVCQGSQSEWVNEQTPLNPQSENAKILLATEQVYLHCNAIACILRLGGIYGPNRELIDRARRFSGKEMPGTGNEPTNNIHLDDILAAIAFCLDHSLKGIYHLVEDDHPTRKELYSNLCQLINLPSPVWNSSSSQTTKSYKVSNHKIKEEGFAFTKANSL